MHRTNLHRARRASPRTQRGREERPARPPWLAPTKPRPGPPLLPSGPLPNAPAEPPGVHRSERRRHSQARLACRSECRPLLLYPRCPFRHRSRPDRRFWAKVPPNDDPPVDIRSVGMRRPLKPPDRRTRDKWIVSAAVPFSTPSSPSFALGYQPRRKVRSLLNRFETELTATAPVGTASKPHVRSQVQILRDG